MKQILIILGLLASVTTFAQSPRIKLNQITKDSLTGSVLISSPTDSGMVYSRDLFISYGADTVLILGGDTLAATSSIISSVLSDGVTVTGDGTTGNELKVDTSTVISTIQGLVDTLSSRGYLTANQTITLSGDVTGSGTTAITATVVDDSHNHIISNVDNLQDSLNAKANDSDLANYVTLSGTDTITGAKTFTAALTQSGGDANFDNGTFFVDESANRVGIGTSSPTQKLEVAGNVLVTTSGSTQPLKTFEATYKQFSVDYPSSPSIYTTQINFANFGRIQYDGNGGYLFIENRSTSASSSMRFVMGTTERMRITNTGNVGIGETIPAEKLDVNGKVKIQDLTGTGGNAVYENGGVLGVASDARFKTYVGDIQNGIALINQLKPKYFIDNRNSSFQQLGFYAQEVKSVINEASYPIGNTDYLGINDRAILATTVKAIQEQQAIIETQASEIDQLKTLITDLTNRLIILENK
jgi:hypothetical protein